MSRAQGLPINFIVLAALAILILILAAGFVIGGGTSAGAALGPQQARNNCNNACNALTNIASSVASAPVAPNDIATTPSYCTLSQSVQGISTATKCTNAALGASCRVSFQDGSSCQVACDGTNNAECV